MNAYWHFYIMILASILIFFLVIRLVQSKEEYKSNFKKISLLSLFVVVIGMLLGKFGASWGLPWWIYYPVPMLMMVLIPPVVLCLNRKKTIIYLLLSFLSAPLIHFLFSFFLNWHEYMPFWKIPYIQAI